MNLLKNRPLTVFCLIFILTVCIFYRMDIELKLIVALVLSLCFLVCIAVSRLCPKIKVRAVYTLFCFLFAIIAVISQIIGIDLARESAYRCEGEREVVFLITEKEDRADSRKDYKIKIERVDGHNVSFKSILTLGFTAELEPGDVICAKANIYSVEKGYSKYLDRDIYIKTEVEDPERAVRVSRNNITPTIFFNSVRDRLSNYMDEVFGDENSALSRGFLLGDKSDIAADVIRDFRRSGASHLLAISGFHISVLIACIEFLLRKLFIGKRVRCALLSVVALVFLALTGFSMSACRSVIMLLCFYFCCILVRESDSITSLFVSVAFIMLVFPNSVVDVGLWLSFLATLGIVAVYIPLSRYMQTPRTRKRRNMIDILKLVFKKILLAILLTFICNIFICIVVWLVFGEISLVSLLSNIILSPISELFIVIIPIAALFGKIPLVGYVSVKLLSLTAQSIIWLCREFSSLPGAVISLRYPFAGIIITAMSVVIVIMLLVELKHKWTIMLPPVAAVLAFCICLGVYNAMSAGKVKITYYSEGNSGAIVLSEGSSAVICDLSARSYSFLDSLEGIAADNTATEISGYIVTDYRDGMEKPMRRFFENSLVRELYLPYPKTQEEYDIAYGLVELAKAFEISVTLYSEGERLDVLEEAYISVIFSDNGKALSSLAVVNRGQVMSYVDARGGKNAFVDRMAESSDFLILDHTESSSVSEFVFGKDTKLKTIPESIKMTKVELVLG